jgi:hypothetical protein
MRVTRSQNYLVKLKWERVKSFIIIQTKNNRVGAGNLGCYAENEYLNNTSGWWLPAHLTDYSFPHSRCTFSTFSEKRERFLGMGDI